MELLQKSLSSISHLLSRRGMLFGAGIVATGAGVATRASAQAVPSHLKFSNPDGMFKPSGYTHVVEMTGPGRTIYIAGQLGWDASGKRAGELGDFTAQATQVFENIKTALNSAGASFDHVVRITVYLTSIANLPKLREVRNKYITGAPPASTALEISKLARPDALLEIEATAVVKA